MSSKDGAQAPALSSFKKTVRDRAVPVTNSLELLIALLKRRQINGSRLCAEATALLLRRVVESFRVGDVSKLIEDVRQVGQRLSKAQPIELAIGNIVRRVLRLIRDEIKEDRKAETSSFSDTTSESQDRDPRTQTKGPRLVASSPLRGGRGDIGSQSASKTLFNLLSQPQIDSGQSPVDSPPHAQQTTSKNSSLSHQALSNLDAAKELRAEVAEGILEIMDEIKQADEQIAGSALEHIHSNDVILTQAPSETVREFLLKAAAKRKFTVFYIEGYPNESDATRTMLLGDQDQISKESHSDRFKKTLAAAGVTVILAPDSAVFAVMCKVNKVILDPHIVFDNGGMVASAGCKSIARATRYHKTPVMVLSAVYKLCPNHPSNIREFLKYGSPLKVATHKDFPDKVTVDNPLYDYVPPDMIDVHITNVGGHAPSSLHLLLADQYSGEDQEL